MPDVESASISLVLDATDNQPLYLQLQQRIVDLIQQQRLVGKQRLPSTRELAHQLNISRTTCATAYDNLIAEGYLVSAPKKGVYVAEYTPSAVTLIDRLSSDQSTIPLNQAPVPYNSFTSSANVQQFSQGKWAECAKRAWQQLDATILGDQGATGFQQIKQQIASYLKSLRGLEVKPEQVVITAGNRDAITIISHAMQPSNVWLENPSYPKLYSVLKMLGHKPHPLSVDQQGAQVPALVMSGLVVATPNRQYPLTMQMSGQRRQDWLAYLEKCKQQQCQTWLVEDDYDSEFIYQGRSISPLMQADTSNRTLLLGSFSKVLFPALRLGYIVAPVGLASKLTESQRALGSSASLGMQPVLNEFIKSGEFAKHLRKMRRLYLANLQRLPSLLTPFDAWFEWQFPQSGLHLVMYLKDKWQGVSREGKHWDALLAEAALEHGIVLDVLSRHYFESPKHSGIIMGFSQVSDNYELSLNSVIKCCQRVFGSPQ